MKKIALSLSLLLIAGCVSSTKLIDERIIDCAENGEILVRLGFDAPGVTMERIGDDDLKFIVEVSNNRNVDIVVKWIRVEQMREENAPYHFDNSYRAFGQLIEEGGDHTFELPSRGRGGALTGFYAIGDVGGAVAVSVGLENGDIYRCSFAVGRR